tara:strand:+ start:168 stop:416 length:249 start_codon:yes stop_codon:yes gene_type:complete
MITGMKHISVKGGKQFLLEDFELIQNKDRTGSNGKNIKCPHCEKVERIYNLKWKTKTCKFCLVKVTKKEWLIDQLDTWRTPR